MKMKPVHITILFFGILITPILLGQLVGADLFISGSISVLLECSLLLVYMYTLGSQIYRRITDELIPQSRYVLFSISLFLIFIYIVIFIFELVDVRCLIPFHILIMALMASSIIFLIQLIITIETGKWPKTKEVLLTFKTFMKENRGYRIFYIWDIQKRINKIFEGNS